MENTNLLDFFLTELFQEKFRKLAKTDGAYAKLKNETAHTTETFESSFTYEEIQTIEDFHDMIAELTELENKFLYIEGFNDCIRLLKKLEVY